MHKVSIRLPPDVRAELKHSSQRSGRSQSAIVREALRDHLHRQEPPPLLSLGSGSNPDLSGEDVEDWLEANWRPEEDWGEQPLR